MGTILIEVAAKRPQDATPEKALRLVEAGKLTHKEIAQLWGISRARVSQLVIKARKTRDAAVPGV